MATINNSDLARELQQGANIQINRDSVPNQLADKVVPVMEVNPKLLKASRSLANIERSTTTSASPGNVIYTCSTTKDTYLTGVILAEGSNATCDNTYIRVRCTQEDGNTNSLALFYKQTTTADNQVQANTFSPPIKLQKGSAVYILNVFTAGASNVAINLLGYENDISLS